MMTGHIIRQRLNLCDSHVVADTIDYLEAKFLFKTDDWDGLDKWAHFANDSAVYDIRLTEDCIRKEDHLNLSAGMWKVYLHGNEFRDGEVIQRITTDEVILYVIPTGTLDGEPFPTVPPSAGEQIIASAEAAEAGAKAAAAEARQAADEAAQYEPEVFWAEYGVTPYADVAAAYDAGKLCGVRHSIVRCIAIRAALAAERFIEFTGTSLYNTHYIIRVYESDKWSTTNAKLLTKGLDVESVVNAESTDDKVPTSKATYDAILAYGGAGGGSGNKIDDTLTVPGAAADAKAVGDKIGEVSKTKADYASVPNKAIVDGSTLKMQRETTTTDDAGTETTETMDLFEVELPSGGEGWTIDGLTTETVIADDDAVPFYDTSAKAQRKTLWSNIKAVLKTYFDTVYLKLSGGTLSGKIVLPTDNQNVGFVNSGDVKIFGYGNIDSVSHLRIGDATRPVQLRGSAERPKYNNNELVLKSEFDAVMQEYIDDIAELVGGDA